MLVKAWVLLTQLLTVAHILFSIQMFQFMAIILKINDKHGLRVVASVGGILLI